MAGLTINGITIPTAREGAKIKTYNVEDMGRAIDGTPMRTVRSRKRQWDLNCTPQTPDRAAILRQLIDGEGQNFNFDGSNTLCSDQGLAPTASSLASESNAYVYFSGWSLKIDGAGFVSWPTSQFLKASPSGVAYSENWTVMFMKSNNGLSNFDHFIWRSAMLGSTFCWKNGVSISDPFNAGEMVSFPFPTDETGDLRFSSPDTDTTTWIASHSYVSSTYARVKPTSGANPFRFWVKTPGTSGGTEPTWPTTFGATVTDGSVVWQNIGRKDQYYNAIVFIPWAVPDEWISDLYAAASAGRWHTLTLPKLYVSGDISNTSGNVIAAMGQSGDSDLLSAAIDGTKYSNAEKFPFTLSEI